MANDVDGNMEHYSFLPSCAPVFTVSLACKRRCLSFEVAGSDETILLVIRSESFIMSSMSPASRFLRQRLILRSSYRNRDSLPMKSFVSQLQVVNITSVHSVTFFSGSRSLVWLFFFRFEMHLTLGIGYSTRCMGVSLPLVVCILTRTAFIHHVLTYLYVPHSIQIHYG